MGVRTGVHLKEQSALCLTTMSKPLDRGRQKGENQKLTRMNGGEKGGERGPKGAEGGLNH